MAEHDPGLVALFCESLAEAGGRAVMCPPASLSATMARLISPNEALAPVLIDGALADLASALSSGELHIEVPRVEVAQEQMLLSDLADVGVGVTTALCGIAKTGTVVVGLGTAYESILSSLCRHHIVVLSAQLIQPDLASALAAVAPHVGVGTRLVFITGPSRTSDIELTPVLGVHGPLQLDVVIVDDEASTIDQLIMGEPT